MSKKYPCDCSMCRLGGSANAQKDKNSMEKVEFWTLLEDRTREIKTLYTVNESKVQFWHKDNGKVRLS